MTGAPHTETDLVDAWARAERELDRAAMDSLLDQDFHGVGPHGFVLDRDGWLDRYDTGPSIERLTIDDPHVRREGPVAITTAVQTQVATYRGQRADGSFRLTLVGRRRPEGWSVLHAQLSGPLPAPAGDRRADHR